MSSDRASADVWRGRASSRVHMLGPQLYRVELSGPLRPGWMASLGVELASRHLSIDRANGRRLDRGIWNAEIDIVRLADSADPLTLSFVALADSGRTPDMSIPIQLDRYALHMSALHGGSLELSFEAPDSLGLLGRLLADLALLVLFPTELRIETHGARVRDRLWLAGIHSAPTAEALGHLQQRLARYVRQSERAK